MFHCCLHCGMMNKFKIGDKDYMKSKIIAIFLFFVLGCASTVKSPTSVEINNKNVNWKNFDYTYEFNAAKDLKKCVFLYFSVYECNNCKKLEDNFFSNKKVIKVLNNNLYPIWIHVKEDDSDKEINNFLVLTKMFTIKQVPAMVVLGPHSGNSYLTTFGVPPNVEYFVDLLYVADKKCFEELN